MTATDDRIAKLEAQIDKLEKKQADLHKQLAKAQIDQWQGRIEDLEVQMHLGAMETNDRLAGLLEQVRARWSEAKSQFEGATSAASDAVETARTRVEAALKDLRQALLDVRNQGAKD